MFAYRKLYIYSSERPAVEVEVCKFLYMLPCQVSIEIEELACSCLVNPCD